MNDFRHEEIRIKSTTEKGFENYLRNLIDTSIKINEVVSIQQDILNIIEPTVTRIFKEEIEKAIQPIRDEIISIYKIKIYSVKELSQILNLTTKTVTKYCQQKTIIATKKGATYIVTHENLLKYISK